MYTIFFFSDVEICYAKINVERYIQFKQEGSCTQLCWTLVRSFECKFSLIMTAEPTRRFYYGGL